jgi:hypothetical protein
MYYVGAMTILQFVLVSVVLEMVVRYGKDETEKEIIKGPYMKCRSHFTKQNTK